MIRFSTALLALRAVRFMLECVVCIVNTSCEIRTTAYRARVYTVSPWTQYRNKPECTSIPEEHTNNTKWWMSYEDRLLSGLLTSRSVYTLLRYDVYATTHTKQ